MTLDLGTVRSASDSTFAGQESAEAAVRLANHIRKKWRRAGTPDLLAAIEEHPNLLQEKSILMELVLEEYQSHCRYTGAAPLSHYCGRFEGFGSSIQNSIFRQLQVQQYLEDNPELLSFVETTPWPDLGDRIEGYDVLEELGRGSLSRVYLCEQIDLGARQVVVKITQGGADEAAVLGKLAHRNIVPIYSATTVDVSNTSYLCMPFRGRSTLLDLIDLAFRKDSARYAAVIPKAGSVWRKTSDREVDDAAAPTKAYGMRDTYVQGVVAMAARLADALASAHAEGILHGDLKPSNVLLTPGGEPLLLDFNLALDRERQLNPCGGTLPYMPPEQLRRVVQSADQIAYDSVYDVRSEIYSFGALLYHVLAGVPPFPPNDALHDVAASADHLLALQRQGPPPLRSFNQDVDNQVEAKVLRCLAWAPEDRPSTMEAVSLALHREHRLAPRLVRRIRARPRTAWTTAAVLMVTIAVTSVWAALLPPYHIREFIEGLALCEKGEAVAAIERFSNAIKEKPRFRKALFERARTELERGDYYMAIAGFRHLVDEFNDGKSMADLAYCYHKSGEPQIAVLEYEAAIAAGCETSAVHNNLAYLLQKTRSNYSQEEAMDLAREHLLKALELDSQSTTIRFNFVTYEVERAESNRTHRPHAAVEHLEALLAVEPQNVHYWETAVILYGQLIDQGPQWRPKGLAALERVATLGNSELWRMLKEFDIPAEYQGLQEIPAIVRIARAEENCVPAAKTSCFLSVFD